MADPLTGSPLLSPGVWRRLDLDLGRPGRLMVTAEGPEGVPLGVRIVQDDEEDPGRVRLLGESVGDGPLQQVEARPLYGRGNRTAALVVEVAQFSGGRRKVAWTVEVWARR